MHVLIGVYSSSTINLEPRSNDSSLRDKKKKFFLSKFGQVYPY